MGYYTNYRLTWSAPDFEIERCNHTKPDGAKFCPTCGLSTAPIMADDAIVNYIKENESLRYALGDDGTGEGAESVKWYDHETDMRALSKAFGTVLFTLTGNGEENEDMWIKYFKNGKVQHAKAQIAFEPFDAKKLK